MSQIIKLQEGGTVEQKFFAYPKGEIEQDRLIKAISVNLDSYLEQQNWSKKRQERFLNSVDNFITGIKNGSITEMSPVGRFTDSRGIEGGGVTDTRGKRFHEDSEAATFIKWVLNSQDPYKAPEVKEEKTDTTPFNINKEFTKSFNRNVFHSDSDQFNSNMLRGVSSIYTEKSQLRKLILDSLKSINPESWGIYGSKEEYLKAVDNVEAKMKEFSSNKTLTLGKLESLLNSLGLDGNFLPYLYNVQEPTQSQESSTQNQSTTQDQTTVQQSQTADTQQQQTADSTTQQQASTSLQALLWNPRVQQWWNNNKQYYYTLHKRTSTDSYLEAQIHQKGQTVEEYLNNLFNLTKNGGLKGLNSKAGKTALLPQSNQGKWVYNNGNSYFNIYSEVIPYLLNHTELAKKFLVKLQDGRGYLIKPTLNNQSFSSLIYDSTNKRFRQVPVWGLINDANVGPLISQTFNTQSIGVASTGIDLYKSGGILKAQLGDKLNLDLVDWDFTKRYQNVLGTNNTLSLQQRNTNVSNDIVPQNNSYDPETGGKEVELQDWWKTWTKQLTSNKKLAEQWAKDYLKTYPNQDKDTNKIKSIYQKAWFNDDGTFNFTNFQEAVKGKHLWADQQNGPGHDVYRGRLYRIKDTDTYDTLENLKSQGYTSVSDNAVASVNPLIDIYEVTKGTNPKATGSQATAIKRHNGQIVANYFRDLPTIAGSLLRYNNTALGNRRLLNEALSSLRPYRKDPKRFDRQIYGDYAATAQAHENAASINQQASQQLTADPNLYISQRMQGAAQAAQERFKGQQANANEIKRTTELTLAQDKENTTNSVDTTNDNRYNAWNAALLRSQAKQGYINKKTENKNQLITEFQNLAQTRQDERQAIDEKAINDYLSQKYSNNPELLALKQQMQQWIADGKPLSASPDYARYIQLSNDLSREMMIERLRLLGRIKNVGVNESIIRGLGQKPATSVPQTRKQGGEITKLKIAKIKDKLERQKLFQKNQSEQIKESSKDLRQLSAGMLKLLNSVIK